MMSQQQQQPSTIPDNSADAAISPGSLNKVPKQQLPADFTPNYNSVICGRGKESFDQIGNRRFRVLVGMYRERYSVARTKTEKSQLVLEVVDTIRNAGGGFCRFKNGSWYEVGDAVAREKVGALFRDGLASKYKSSSKAKIARRRENNNRKRQQAALAKRRANDLSVPLPSDYLCSMPQEQRQRYVASSTIAPSQLLQQKPALVLPFMFEPTPVAFIPSATNHMTEKEAYQSDHSGSSDSNSSAAAKQVARFSILDLEEQRALKVEDLDFGPDDIFAA